MAHDKRRFTLNDEILWFHLSTDSLNVMLVKKAWARCWVGSSPYEAGATSLREPIAGSHMRVELKKPGRVKCDAGNDVSYREIHMMGARSFGATASAQLTLPDGDVISLSAPA